MKAKTGTTWYDPTFDAVHLVPPGTTWYDPTFDGVTKKVCEKTFKLPLRGVMGSWSMAPGDYCHRSTVARLVNIQRELLLPSLVNEK